MMFTSTCVTGCGGTPGEPSESQGTPSFATMVPVLFGLTRRPGPVVCPGKPLPVAFTPSRKMPGAPPCPVWSEVIQFPSASTMTLWLLSSTMDGASADRAMRTGAGRRSAAVAVGGVRSTPGTTIVVRTNSAPNFA